MSSNQRLIPDPCQQVREFTEESKQISCPRVPQSMSKDTILYLLRMVFSELHELTATVSSNEYDAKDFMMHALHTMDLCHKFDYPTEEEKIGAQADSLVDAWYYMLNVATNHGMNLSRIFQIVHKANMDKRDPATGKFIRRETDGKIMKPAGWREPDITGEIKRQMTEGSWS
jgi:predicted HAD superfamily Cof-like phosphohydrolase